MDLSIFANGWQPGTFIGAGPLPGSATFYTWNGLTAKTTHYFRVNQLLASGSWDASTTYRFTTGCGSDTAATYALLGFTDHRITDSAGLSTLIASGGAICACKLSALYAYVRVTNVPAPMQMGIDWFLNGSSAAFPHRLFNFEAGSGVYSLSLSAVPGDSLFPGPYALKGSTGGSTNEFEGSITLSC